VCKRDIDLHLTQEELLPFIGVLIIMGFCVTNFETILVDDLHVAQVADGRFMTSP
jgi:hypothetical protein